MSNGIREQFVRDMQVAGLSAGTQGQYLSCVDLFFKATWLSPEAVVEQDVQTFLIGLRERDVARETFRGYRFALECFFANTLGRDWPLFTKKTACAVEAAPAPGVDARAVCGVAGGGALAGVPKRLRGDVWVRAADRGSGGGDGEGHRRAAWGDP